MQSGGKFDGSKEPSEQLRAAFFSEMMTVGMAKQYKWHTEMAINTLAQPRVALDPDCEDLNPETYSALQGVFRSKEFAETASKPLSRYGRT